MKIENFAINVLLPEIGENVSTMNSRSETERASIIFKSIHKMMELEFKHKKNYNFGDKFKREKMKKK